MDSRLRSTARVALGAAVVFAAVLFCALPAEARIFGRRWSYAPAAQVISPATALRPRQEQVMQLPEDGDTWDLVVVSDGSAAGEQLLQAVRNTPRLADLSSKVKLHVWQPNHWWIKQYLPAEPMPLFFLQDQTGARVYKASGADFPASGEELADEVESSVWAYNEQCGPDCPQPTPETRPKIFTKQVAVIPNNRPAVVSSEWQIGGGLILLALVAAFIMRRFSK